MTTPPDDPTRVAELLGRMPRGRYDVVVRDPAGDPVVLRNAPFLDDGTPMPTRYWLVSADEQRRIGRLEADGGVDAAEAAIPADELAAAHARYAAERDAEIPADHVGPRPTGGVGGTRVGVKCLHAHWAWYLAGGDDPVGRWIEQQLATRETGALHDDTRRPLVTIEQDETVVVLPDGTSRVLPWGADNLTDRWLRDTDPPRPEALTNALGAMADHLDDVLREHPDLLDTEHLTFAGPTIVSLARVEVGGDVHDDRLVLARSAAEEIFRMVASDTAVERAHHPGLPSAHVDTIVATCCIVLACLRRLHLDAAELIAPPGPALEA